MARRNRGARSAHHHLVCVSCKKVLDLHDDRFDALRVSSRMTQGFEVRAVRVQVEGVCPDCRAAARDHSSAQVTGSSVSSDKMTKCPSGSRKANSRRR